MTKAKCQPLLDYFLREDALIVLPTAVQLIWHLYRSFPRAIYQVSIHRVRMFRSIRVEPEAV